MRAKNEIDLKEKNADAASSEAKQKKAEAIKATKAAEKADSAYASSVEEKRKIREEAAIKDTQSKEAAAITVTKESEAKNTREDFELSHQETIKARQMVKAEEKAYKTAELKAKEEIDLKEKDVSTARSKAKRKTAEANKAITYAKKIVSDKKASAAVKQKVQEEASVKEAQARDTAVIAVAKEIELKKAREDFKLLHQETIKARQTAKAKEKARQAAEEKAEDEMESKEKAAATARLKAERKAKEADKATKALKDVDDIDDSSLIEAKNKTQEEASAKEAQAGAAASITTAKEIELKKAREDFELLRQERIKAKQLAAAEAKAKIESKIKAQEKARLKARPGTVGEQTAETTAKNWWKRGFKNAAKPGEAGKWKISAGVLLRTIRGQSFKTYSYSQNYNIPAKAGDVFSRYAPAGDLNSFSERNYEDGYVYKDDYTDLDGGTWNWGYDNSGQVQDGSIAFHFVGRTYTEYSRTKDISVGETLNNSDREIAPYIQLERVLYQTGWFDTGLHLDIARVTFSDAAQYANFSDQQEWKNYSQYDEDIYLLTGTGITPSSPPYQGNRPTPGPSIDNVPNARRGSGTVETGSYSYNAYNNIQQSLDMNLGTLSLGALISANWRRLSLSGIAGPTFNMVNIETAYTETLYTSINNRTPEAIQTWNDSQNYSECKFGGFVQVQLGLRIIDGMGVGIFGRYDWLENMSGNFGQSRYMINPEGGSLGATANLNF